MWEKSYLFSSWVSLVLYLTVLAYEPSNGGLVQLNMAQTGTKTSFGHNSWHSIPSTLLLLEREGGLAHASLASYAMWNV